MLRRALAGAVLRELGGEDGERARGDERRGRQDAKNHGVGDRRLVALPRWLAPHGLVAGLDAQRLRRGPVHDDVDPEHLHGVERLGQAQELRARDDAERSERRRELEREEVADVVEDGLALVDGVEDAEQLVVGEDDVRGLLGDVRARDAHGDADVRGLERGRVVDAVARHGAHLAGPALLLQHVCVCVCRYCMYIYI